MFALGSQERKYVYDDGTQMYSLAVNISCYPLTLTQITALLYRETSVPCIPVNEQWPAFAVEE